MDQDLSYALGYNAGKHGPNHYNCFWQAFATPTLARSWHEGYDAGLKKRNKNQETAKLANHDHHTQPDSPENQRQRGR